MKQVAACILALLAASQAISVHNDALEYHAGQQYRYSYRGLSQNGGPMLSNERTGIAVFTDLTLSFETSEQVVLQLENPAMRHINFTDANDRLPVDKVPTLDDALKSRIFQKLPEEIEKQLIDSLKEPIRFVFSKTTGQISDIKAAEREPEWSLNIKLGVVERFQLQVSKSQIGAQVTENTLLGKSCGVYYDSTKTTESNKRNVTKVFNLDDCEKHVILHDVGGLFARKSSDKTLRSSQFTNAYVDVSDNEHEKRCFLHTAITEGRVTARLYDSNQGELTTFTKQVIEFREKTKRSIAMSTHNLIKRTASLYRPITRQSVSTSVYDDIMPESDKILMVEKLLEQITSTIETEDSAKFSLESSMEYMYVAKLMQSLKKPESFTQLVGNIHKKGISQLRPMLINALAFCGNPALVKALPEFEKMLTPLELNGILTCFPLTLQPTKDTIETLKKMLSTDRVHSTTKQLLLVIGAQTHSLCRTHPTNENHPSDICSFTFRTTMIDFFKQAYKTSDEKDRVIVIKAIGNSGLDMSDFLGERIRTSETTSEIRVNAIYALRRCENLGRIVDILMPVFRNEMSKYPVEMRIAAFNILVNSIPEEDMLVSLVSVLNAENDKQLGNYIYSYIDSLVKLPTIFAHSRNLTVAAQTLLPTVRRFEDGIYYSKNIQFILRQLSTQVAQFIEANVIDTPETFLPRSMNLRIMTSFYGYYINMVEAGFRFEGLDELIRSMLLHRVATVFDSEGNISGRWKREFKYIEALLKQDATLPRDLANTKGYIFLKYLGHELGVITMDDIASFDYKGTAIEALMAVADEIRHFTIAPLSQATVRAQTPLGIPTITTWRFVSMFSLHGDNVNNRPQHSIISKKITTRFAIKSVGTIGSDVGLFRTSIAMEMYVKAMIPLVAHVTHKKNTFGFEMHLDTESSLYQSGIPGNKRLVDAKANLGKVVEIMSTETLDYSFQFTPLLNNPLLPNYEMETENHGLRVSYSAHNDDTTVKRPPFPTCGLHSFTIEMTDEVKPWGTKVEITPTMLPDDRHSLKLIAHLNPQIETLKKELEVIGTLNLNRAKNLPLLMIEVAPKWVTNGVYKVMFSGDVLSGKTTPTFSWREAAKLDDQLWQFLTQVQLGWDIRFLPNNQDLVIKTILSKSDLQKIFEIEELKLVDSDCSKCEQDIAKGIFTTIDCGTCMNKRSWLSKIQSDIFLNPRKIYLPEGLRYTLDYIFYPYFNAIESQDNIEDIKEKLINQESNLINSYLSHLTLDKLAASRYTLDVHPYFSEFNATILDGHTQVVLSHIPLVPAHRKLYNLPLHRLTDVASKRFQTRRPQCVLDSNNTVMTMDGVRYTLPRDTQCEQVLVREIKENVALEISTKLTTDNRRTVVIKMAGRKFEIEQVKTGEHYVVKVNNVLQQWQPVPRDRQVREIVTGRIRAVMQPISVPHGHDFTVSLELLPVKATISMAGNLVTVDLPIWYKNQIGGLCGDFNGETTHELVLRNHSLALTLDSFARAYSEPNCVRTA